MFLKRAREPYEPNMSAAMMTPPVNFTPSTDVPVTIGLLQKRKKQRDLSPVLAFFLSIFNFSTKAIKMI